MDKARVLTLAKKLISDLEDSKSFYKGQLKKYENDLKETEDKIEVAKEMLDIVKASIKNTSLID